MLDFLNSSNPSVKQYHHFGPLYEDQKLRKEYRSPKKKKRRNRAMTPFR